MQGTVRVRDTYVLHMPLSLEDANKVVAGVHAKAAKMGLTVTAAVVDEGGHLIALGRMDGAPPLSPQIAEAKAVGAAMLLRDGASSRILQRRGPPRPPAADSGPRVPPDQEGRADRGRRRCQRRAP